MTVKEAAQVTAYRIGAAWVMPGDTLKPPNIMSGRKVLNKKEKEKCDRKLDCQNESH